MLELHRSIIQLAVAYVLLGVFMFTAVVTCLAWIGKAKISDKKQQKRLTNILMVELAAGCVAFFLGFIKFNPKAVQREVIRDEFAERRKIFDQKLKEAKATFDQGKLEVDQGKVEEGQKSLSKAYDGTTALYLSSELSEYFPVRDLFILSGDVASERKFWREATESYGPALRLDPNNVNVISSAGLAYRNLTQYELAEKLYQRALTIKGQDWAVLNGYLNCLRRFAGFLKDSTPLIADQKFQLAVEIADQTIGVAQNDKQRSTSELSKAKIYWQWDKNDVALQMYQSLISKYPNDARFKEDLAAVLSEIGRNDDAYKIYNDMYLNEEQSKNKSAFVGAGLAEAAAKASIGTQELERALNAGLFALSLDPKDPFNSYAVALVLKKLGRDDEAKRHLAAAIQSEEQRQLNLYTSDKKKHEEYLALWKVWTGAAWTGSAGR